MSTELKDEINEAIRSYGIEGTASPLAASAK